MPLREDFTCSQIQCSYDVSSLREPDPPNTPEKDLNIASYAFERKEAAAMRIALLSWETLHSIPVGGVGVHVTELAAALERKGHDVHVFTRMGAWQQPYQRIDGVHYHRCPFPLNADFVAEVDDMCRSFVDHVLQTEGYIGAFDVIHAHSPPPLESYYASSIARKKKIPFVITYHCDLSISGIIGKKSYYCIILVIETYTVNRSIYI